MKCSRAKQCYPDAPYPDRWEARKPELCESFPTNQANVDENPSCSYYFEGDERKGECSQCGECCQRPYLFLPEFDRKFTDERCPYLED